VSACTPGLSPSRLLWLAQLDRDPAALLEHLSVCRTHRLGAYFEQLWHFFLKQDPDTELIAHNVPVREAGKTLGEFDCLYYNKRRGCHVHLELAVKYFLGLPRNDDVRTPANAHEWIGPDRRDRLGTKLDQLLQRQIQLGNTSVGRRGLGELNIHTTTREIALKGYLFQPLEGALPPPPGYNPACGMNLWLRCGHLNEHCANLNAAAFIIPPKMTWLSAVQLESSETRLGLQELQPQVLVRLVDDPYPLLVAALDHNGLESSRFFVTPQSWPNN
jgi:hypothetical protein